MSDDGIKKGPGRRKREDIPIDKVRSLREDGYSWGQISRILNYSSIHVFTRSFRNYFGMTPSEYRRSRRTASESAAEVPGKTKDKDRNHENRDL